VVSAVWFAALFVFFLAFESSLPPWSIGALTFGALGWMGFFLGPLVWHWISGSRRSNAAIQTTTRVFGVAMLIIWSLLLYGALVFWMPYFRETFVP